MDRVLTMDLHAAQIQGFFRVPVDHLYAMPLFVDYFRTKVTDPREWTVVAPDAGFAKQARDYARALGTGLVVVDKSRGGPDEKVSSMDVIGNVKGKKALVVDDVVLAGSTVISGCERLLEEGATEVYAAITHGVLSAGAAELIANSGLTELVLTDTVEHRFEPLPRKVQIISAAKLFARAIRSIYERTSVSQLFDV